MLGILAVDQFTEKMNIYHENYLRLLGIVPEFCDSFSQTIDSYNKLQDFIQCIVKSISSTAKILNQGYFYSSEIAPELNIKSSLLDGAFITYYSYQYRFGERNSFNKTVEEYCERLHLSKKNIRAVKREVFESRSKLCLYLQDVHDKDIKYIPNDNKINISKVDSNILCSIMQNYNYEPFKTLIHDPDSNAKKATYSYEDFKIFRRGLRIEDNIDKLLSEQIYHFKLIEYLIAFYNEFVSIIRGLEYDMDIDITSCMTLKELTEFFRITNSKHYKIVYNVSSNKEPSTPNIININSIIRAVTEFDIRFNRSLEYAKCSFIEGVKLFIRDLCYFAYIPGVISRYDLVKKLVADFTEKFWKDYIYINESSSSANKLISKKLLYGINEAAVMNVVFYSFFYEYASSKYNIKDKNAKRIKNPKRIVEEKRMEDFFKDSIKDLNEYLREQKILTAPEFNSTDVIDKEEIFPIIFETIFGQKSSTESIDSLLKTGIYTFYKEPILDVHFFHMSSVNNILTALEKLGADIQLESVKLQNRAINIPDNLIALNKYLNNTEFLNSADVIIK